MADEGKYEFGKGGARQNIINALKQKQKAEIQAHNRFLIREQIIFFVLIGISVAPLIYSFQLNGAEGYKMFKIGVASLLGLYPSYLFIRLAIGAIQKTMKKSGTGGAPPKKK